LDSIQFRRHLSLNVLIRMLVLAALIMGLLWWKLDFINEVYFRDQLTPTGIIINGAILTLFLMGLVKMVASFLGYAREERALLRFIDNFEHSPRTPLVGVDTDTIIHRRYAALKRLHEGNTPINQSALAATLMAAESTRNSLPKFINNVLILCGVFGTIIALSIALIGASDMLETAVTVGGMGLVVHGMSTALSTTITAIFCFLYFGYFYLKLQDVQTNLISAVEQTTTNLLLPHFQIRTETVLFEMANMVRSLRQLVKKMETTQNTFQDIEQQVLSMVTVLESKVHTTANDLSDIRDILRVGFRLPDDDSE